MDRPRQYLVRYGLAARVGRFAADGPEAYARGQSVVIRSHRGTEIGEVLLAVAPSATGVEVDVDVDVAARILRPAGPDDLAQARRALLQRPERFAACQRVFASGVWPIEVVDVEVLLDEDRVVAQFLGPHGLDLAGLHAVFRNDHGLNMMLEPVGLDADLENEDEALAGQDQDHNHGCGHCDIGGCGSASSGCGSCGVKQLLAARR